VNFAGASEASGPAGGAVGADGGHHLAAPLLPQPRTGCDPSFKLPWREAGPPNHRDDKVDSGQ